MMVQAGHDKARAGGLIAASGVIGPIIPPSIGFVVFGVIGGVSITKSNRQSNCVPPGQL